MAKRWYIDTSASEETVLRAARTVFFTKPTIGVRLKFWSKSAQLQSNIRWKEVRVDDAAIGAEVVSGGMREAAASSKNGTGSMLGTTIAVSCDQEGSGQVVQLWLAGYNTFLGMNQQGDVLKSYAKQICRELTAGGAEAIAHK